ncbi:MAG: hypothetical protein RLZZ546_2487 [Bacteroidota bacterium]|jgi:hypothetical protein
MKVEEIKMKLSITGNSEFFQSPLKEMNTNTLLETYSIEGVFTHDYSKSIAHLSIKDIPIINIAADKLFTLSEKIRGTDFDNIGDTLTQHSIGDSKYWENNLNTYQEYGMIKSLFNTYLWVETYFLDAFQNEDRNIENIIYDEVIIDYSGRLGKVDDMYLLPKEYSIDKQYEKIVSHLLSINLLCKIDIDINGIKYPSYFIPFIKPGVERKLYRNDDIDTYPFWNMLLSYRDKKLKELFSQS